MAKTSRLIGLERYGISADHLDRLGRRQAVFSIHMKGLSQLPLLRFPPQERQRRLRAALDAQLRRLVRDFPDAHLKSRGGLGWTLDGRLATKKMRGLAARPEVNRVFIRRISGLRPKRETARDSWFCVRGKVAIQVEGKTRGRLDIEERFVLVKARTRREAERRLTREWRMYAEPYLNKYGYAVRWKLVEVSEVYDLNQYDIDPLGTEVYSEFKSERMKPEYRWRPNGKRV